MAMFGSLIVQDMAGAPIPKAAGCGQILAGPGYLISRGVGLLFIMAAGVGMITPAGTGSRVHNGGRPGLPGEEEVLI